MHVPEPNAAVSKPIVLETKPRDIKKTTPYIIRVPHTSQRQCYGVIPGEKASKYLSQCDYSFKNADPKGTTCFEVYGKLGVYSKDGNSVVTQPHNIAFCSVSCLTNPYFRVKSEINVTPGQLFQVQKGTNMTEIEIAEFLKAEILLPLEHVPQHPPSPHGPEHPASPSTSQRKRGSRIYKWVHEPTTDFISRWKSAHEMVSNKTYVFESIKAQNDYSLGIILKSTASGRATRYKISISPEFSCSCPDFARQKTCACKHILVFYIVHLGIQDLNKYSMVYQKAMVLDEVKVLYKLLAEKTLP